jgi:hypothetical protein
MRTRIVATVLTVALVAVSANVAFACDRNKASAQAASAQGSCSYSKATATVATATNGKGVVMAVPAGSSCSASKGAGSTAASRTGCDVCDEYAGCDERLTLAGAVTQVVPLKNGVMFVYTSESPKNAHKIQAAVRHRNDRIVEIVAVDTEVTLCDGCDAMRGAMASGKLHREVVNVEGGSLTLVTSDDPAVVKAIQEVSGVTSAAAKS